MQHESGIGAQILIDLGLKDIRVLTNHPKKVVALEGYGITIADQVPLRIEQPKRNSPALMTLQSQSAISNVHLGSRIATTRKQLVFILRMHPRRCREGSQLQRTATSSATITLTRVI